MRIELLTKFYYKERQFVDQHFQLNEVCDLISLIKREFHSFVNRN